MSSKNTTKNTTHRLQGGFAYLLALVLLVVFAALGLALSSAAGLSLRTSDNYSAAAAARLQAEGGMAYMLHEIDALRLPGTTTQATFLANLLASLAPRMDGTDNLAGQNTHISGSYVVVPDIATEDGSFSSRFSWAGTDRGRLSVQGTARNVSQRISVDLVFTSRRPAVFDYGLASKGQITIFGHAKIVGVNSPTEASVLSATQTNSNAICLNDSSVTVSGDLYAAGNTNVSISPGASVAGSTDPNVVAAHVHLGVDPPDFPEVDIAPIAALATDTLNTSNPKNSSYTNIRIPANLNPSFNSDVVLNGVVYVEAPNNVTFNGHASVNGLIVADGSGNPLASCGITFMGNVHAYGVEALPNTPEYASVKEMTGTFVAAPGFGLTFKGNVTVDNGSIAADQLTFNGNAEGIVHGSVIGLKDLPTSVGGSVEIYVDRTNADQNPAGFARSVALVPDGETYLELTGVEP
jgi:Tfp pilus assembly protein PilX